MAFIAKTLGTDRVIKELIPYLRECNILWDKEIINDETAVVLQVLEEVYKIAKVIGGGNNAAQLFLLVEDLL